jgi:hypothetical protein
MDETVAGDSDELGLLGTYGVLVVPAPAHRDSGWLVTLSEWQDDEERYVAGADGPIFNTRDEALQEAGRIMDWLATRSDDENLLEVWAQMQQLSSEQEMWPDGRPGRLHYQW